MLHIFSRLQADRALDTKNCYLVAAAFRHMSYQVVLRMDAFNSLNVTEWLHGEVTNYRLFCAVVWSIHTESFVFKVFWLLRKWLGRLHKLCASRPFTAIAAFDNFQVIDVILLLIAHEKKAYVIPHFAVGIMFQGDVERRRKHTKNLVTAHTFCFSLHA